jgi:methyl-accepting chemotaxis protein
MEVTRNSNVWIIRAGIFGTLIGLVIAFFELYLAMTTMKSDAKLSSDFIAQIQQALLGNSLAVATSITAHGIALVLEVVISSFMRKESNSMWLDHAFAQLSTFDKYTPEISSTTELFGPLSLSTDEMVNELETAKNELSELTPKTTKASGLLNELNDHIHDLNSSLKSFGDKVTSASEVTLSIGDNYRELTTSTGNLTKKIDEATNTISKLNEYYGNYVNSMGKSVEAIQDSSSRFVSGLMSGLTDLGEKLTNLGESNEDKGQDI